MTQHLLTKEDILNGLHRIDNMAREKGVLVDLAIYGGAAHSLVFDMREITRDVDFAMQGDVNFVRKAAIDVASELGWPEDWLNDGVKGFLSNREELESLPGFQGEGGSGLRVHTPSAHYLFAMKCMAMRGGGVELSHDIRDIEELAKVIGIENAEQALEIV